jgi:hypothetical protein
MSAASLALQGAVYAALSTALAPTKVYDDPPQGCAFPYVVVGEDACTDASSKIEEGEDIDLTVHAWSRYQGKKQAREIIAAIKDALHGQPLTVAGWGLVLARFEFSTVFPDPDGLTMHGVARFRFVLSRD